MRCFSVALELGSRRTAGLTIGYSEARENGIRVWDVLWDEEVLVIPWILAFLGDNPMSSEFASHIGMQGKCFCRRCDAKGADVKNRAAGEEGDKSRLHEFLKVRTYCFCLLVI